MWKYELAVRSTSLTAQTGSHTELIPSCSPWVAPTELVLCGWAPLINHRFPIRWGWKRKIMHKLAMEPASPGGKLNALPAALRPMISFKIWHNKAHYCLPDNSERWLQLFKTWHSHRVQSPVGVILLVTDIGVYMVISKLIPPDINCNVSVERFNLMNPKTYKLT